MGKLDECRARSAVWLSRSKVRSAARLVIFGADCHSAHVNFPRFWAKGAHNGFECWRWSNASLNEAQSLAKEAARKLAERFAAGRERLNRYAYADRPLREPVLRELKNAAGDVAAVITRNSYGCLVINTARVMFVDVDLPEPKDSGDGFFKRLFGKAEVTVKDAPHSQALAKAAAWVKEYPNWAWRVYRTRAGFRLLATHALFDPDPAISDGAFDALGADPLYRQLCKMQKCFRARLTPKPWRCGVSNPPVRWPFPDAKAETRFKDWEIRYAKACAERATCELVTTIGHNPVHPDVQLVIAAHDEATRAESKLALA